MKPISRLSASQHLLFELKHCYIVSEAWLLRRGGRTPFSHCELWHHTMSSTSSSTGGVLSTSALCGLLPLNDRFELRLWSRRPWDGCAGLVLLALGWAKWPGTALRLRLLWLVENGAVSARVFEDLPIIAPTADTLLIVVDSKYLKTLVTKNKFLDNQRLFLWKQYNSHFGRSHRRKIYSMTVSCWRG